ncbi:hypothetical protein A2U01_0035079, partial [Trifolium medium]|nr:hypothetical protein [Trifolium medium]
PIQFKATPYPNDDAHGALKIKLMLEKSARWSAGPIQFKGSPYPRDDVEGGIEDKANVGEIDAAMMRATKNKKRANDGAEETSSRKKSRIDDP